MVAKFFLVSLKCYGISHRSSSSPCVVTTAFFKLVFWRGGLAALSTVINDRFQQAGIFLISIICFLVHFGTGVLVLLFLALSNTLLIIFVAHVT